MRHALAALQPQLPLTGERLEQLDDEAIQDLDQFVLRFGKLQDAMGARLFPSVLGYLQEPYEDRPMLDKLHRLEKLGYLEETDDWQRIRAIRNGFAHDYPDQPEKKAALLNLAVEAAGRMEGILERVESRLSSYAANTSPIEPSGH